MKNFLNWFKKKSQSPEDHIKSFCKKKNLQDTVSHSSPSGNYVLKIQTYNTGEGTWNYSKCEVYRNRKFYRPVKIAEVHRNYGSFPFAFVEEHPNGHDYLICGEDYQGQTVIELDTGERRNYLPDSAAKGHGFCWASFKPNPKGDLIAVEGCYWAAPYEVWIVDFSEPLNMPWKCLERETDLDKFEGWIDDDSCEIIIEYEFCPTINKSYNDMTYEECEEIAKLACSQGKEEDDYYETRTNQQRIWKR